MRVQSQGHLIKHPDGYGDMPEWLRPKYLLKRIDEEDIELTLEERNAVCDALVKRAQVVFVKGSMISAFSIKSIDPKHGVENIPPKPKVSMLMRIENGKAYETPNPEDQERLTQWTKYYGEEK